MPVFDPVVKNGLFEVEYVYLKRRYRAVDVAEAKAKMIRACNLPHLNETLRAMSVKTIEPTKRRFDDHPIKVEEMVNGCAAQTYYFLTMDLAQAWMQSVNQTMPGKFEFKAGPR